MYVRAYILIYSTQNDMLNNDVEDLTDENQKLNKECEKATSEAIALKEDLAAVEKKVCMLCVLWY